ncbi:tRNA-Val4 [Bacillus subtilis]|uniref:tRNA-Val4 n=1 Tax=Bacillus subtilis TaxID=1423 RepID=UPI002E1DF9B0|nr:tRNA-Val4 [Bacillus subtilis]
MKYPYKFEEDPFGDLGIVLPEEISIFSDFIENIATEEQTNEYIDYIEKISEGIYEDFEIELNATNVLIKKDVTIVENSIETDQFRELLLIWRDKIPDIFKG